MNLNRTFTAAEVKAMCTQSYMRGMSIELQYQNASKINTQPKVFSDWVDDLIATCPIIENECVPPAPPQSAQRVIKEGEQPTKFIDEESDSTAIDYRVRRTEILARINESIQHEIDSSIKISNITEELNLSSDLGFDSLDKIALSIQIERRFQIRTIPDTVVERWKTVKDIVDYVEQQN